MQQKTIRPLGNRVLIKRTKQAIKKGQILLPETAQEKPKEGEVIAVGPGNYDKEGKRIPIPLKVGDRVLFSSYAGTEVNPDSDTEDFLVIAEDDILAKIS